MNLFRRNRRAIRVGVTLSILLVACVAGVLVWRQFSVAPWTRDGQVLADVVDLAPQVSGRIVAVHVADNQAVKKGDPVYEIESIDYELALASAEATVQSRLADQKLKQTEAERRARLSTLSTSEEEQQSFNSAAQVAAAALASAVAQRNQARLDLERTRVTSPVNGFVTNLLLRVGDTAAKGTRNLSLVDSDSFYALGYFQETKLAGIRVGDQAVVSLIGYRDPVRGHVSGIARGINTPNAAPGVLGLASVSPVFTWVRLAQRVPVRIDIDQVPPTVLLAAGLTATVSVGIDAAPGTWHGLISRITQPTR